jgi:hypothetical protein
MITEANQPSVLYTDRDRDVEDEHHVEIPAESPTDTTGCHGELRESAGRRRDAFWGREKRG